MQTWNGEWKNDLGSAMEIAIEDGSVTGTYHTNVGRPDAAESFRLSGFVHDDLIAVVVDFGAHGSLTAWTGRLADGEIRSLWNLVRNRDDAGDPIDMWASTLTGAAVFRRA